MANRNSGFSCRRITISQCEAMTRQSPTKSNKILHTKQSGPDCEIQDSRAKYFCTHKNQKMNFIKKQLLLSFCAVLFATGFTNAQVKIGDNPNTIDVNSILELESTNKG